MLWMYTNFSDTRNAIEYHGFNLIRIHTLNNINLMIKEATLSNISTNLKSTLLYCQAAEDIGFGQ